ncbi:MAG TPA: FAD-binding oxidoreductase, partial [Planctomycetota bacterium]|nr:FAD-binding oxidoreductase [Planctomycetota bacterium]
KPIAHAPGQFVFLTLRRKGRKSEEHPFTISSSPAADGAFTVTVKKSGVFTNTIDRTAAGDGALVEGPFGRFSYVHTDAQEFLFIAGGVGITPIMSMLRTLRDTGDARPAVLIFANKTGRDILFRDELSKLPANVQVVHVLSQAPDDWRGPTGYVTAEVLTEHAGAMLKSAEVYLCGPPPMMDAVTVSLRSLGVPNRRIHTERFAL